MTDWIEDSELGQGFYQTTLDLGDDPDDEGTIYATLVRADRPAKVSGAVLYIHGFSDYFFQRELATFFTDRGFAFYALDLRKCGRSRRPEQTAHYVSDLGLYDVELDRSLEQIRADVAGPVIVLGHSTGGLIAPLWLARRAKQRGASELGVDGLILNSPWFDLQGADWARGVGTQMVRAAAMVRPKDVLRMASSSVYGRSISAAADGEWDVNPEFKPIDSFPVTIGWLNAVRRGQAELHEGLNLRVPSLVLRSSKTHFSRTYSEKAHSADVVLDVKQIARWSGCLGGHTWVVPIKAAMHDVFLSRPDPRTRAYEVVDAWLRDRHLTDVRADR